MLKLFNVAMSNGAVREVSKTLGSGMITQGPKVEEFEKNLGDYLEHNRIVTVNSCTSAIHLALAVLKEHHWLNTDTEVLTTPLTCAATNMPIVQNGFKIKWCDVDPKTLNIEEPLDLLDDLIAEIRKGPLLWMDRFASVAGWDRIASRRVFVLVNRHGAYSRSWLAATEALLEDHFY